MMDSSKSDGDDFKKAAEHVFYVIYHHQRKEIPFYVPVNL